jgi:predicted nucleotide-binding protein (sugar kinase/HSP70/actin superfamily)
MLFPKDKILPPPATTKKTISLGEKYSPDFVCAPFKYNLGNMIEALDSGADTIMIVGGGCRYGYYSELQEQILNDLQKKFTLVNLFDSGGLKLRKTYKKIKNLGSPISFFRYLHILLLTAKTVKFMDNLEIYIRANIGFEKDVGSFEKVRNEFYSELKAVRTFKSLDKIRKRFNREFRNLPLNKPAKILRVGLIGELYTVMEPFANYNMERELAKFNMNITRYTDATYLIFTPKKRKEKLNIRGAKGYAKYYLGADGTHSVAKCRALAKAGCDGVIHVKAFGCTPEVNAMPALNNIKKDFKIPVLFFSFDAQTSETGIKTRLEAFHDMLVRR